MSRFTQYRGPQALACIALASALSGAFAADDTSPAASTTAAMQNAPSTTVDTQQPPAASQPAPNPAAEKALGQRFQAIFAAFEGKGALPDAKTFTDDFNQQVTPEQVKETLAQVRQSVGSCKLAGQMRSSVSFAGSYLLQCEKAFVPMDIAVEEKAPYRIHSLLIRGGYWKK
ncbi:MAG: hypothetical protein RSD57_10110 [Comamonas sp.]